MNQVAKLVFMCLLSAVSQGYGLRGGSFPMSQRMVVFQACTALASFVIEQVAELAHSGLYQTTTSYETPGGRVLVATDLGWGLYFAAGVRAVLLGEKHAAQAKYLQVCGAVGGSWFLLLPLLALIAAQLEPHQRHLWLQLGGALQLTYAGAGCVFLWPSGRTGRRATQDHDAKGKELVSILQGDDDEDLL